MRFTHLTIVTLVLGLTAACSEDPPPKEAYTPVDEASPVPAEQAASPTRFQGAQLALPRDMLTVDPAQNADRNAYYGDLHVHTRYSFDAFAFGTIASPADAYRYARGEPLRHPGGFDVRLKRPMDFYAVTDHAMFIGAARAAADTDHPFSKYEKVEGLHNLNAPDNLTQESLPTRTRVFATVLADILRGVSDGSMSMDLVNDIARDAWDDVIDAAEEHNDPGEFTTFVAYEYTTSTDDRGNLHRNVIFQGADKLPAVPFSRFNSQNPEDLWDWMDHLRDQGIEAMAIPHNSNGSNGQMFKLTDWADDPMDDEYTAQRQRNEPLIELTQVKGTSETHPALSPNDEWADFEIMPYRVATVLESEPVGSYAREALLNGLSFADKDMTNPYQFGFVGASDTHTGAISVDESDFFMKVGLLDATPEQRGSIPLKGAAAEEARVTLGQPQDSVGVAPQFKEVSGEIFADGQLITFGAAGLTGVWAEENTRQAIYEAFRRKETFATSGTRIKVRFFGGFNFDDDMVDDDDALHRAYSDGVSMGSELLAQTEGAPAFLAWAIQDAMAAPLQRLQVIKGWTVDGQHQEQVYDVACSDDGEVDPTTNRCPDNGATVNLSDCSISDDRGAAELKTVWTDPDYSPDQRAFYYLRVIENPTCRWSTWDALRAGTEPRADYPATIQERAWSSPIWLIPQD